MTPTTAGPKERRAAAEEGSAFRFELRGTCPETSARLGRLETPHGPVETPVFMPVGTRASVKGVLPRDLHEAGTTMLLANTYHLHLRPGEDVIEQLGGLHRFMGWHGPILTDSGGYQVFSLDHLTKLDDSGAVLRSVVNGDAIRLDPERATEIQRKLGPDVLMAFDHCPSDPLDRSSVREATNRTHAWLDRCVAHFAHSRRRDTPQALFGIVQGGAFADLRAESAARVAEFDLPGYAIGGVSVGEHSEAMDLAVSAAAPELPVDKPRYLMGVGTPRDFVAAVASGVDMFDCVTPTRHGRNHQAYTREGRINLRNLRFATDGGPIDDQCDCATCEQFSRGYLRHLCKSGEMLAGTLISLHNLRFFHRLMERIREAVPRGEFPALVREVQGWGC